MPSLAAQGYGNPIHAGELHGEIVATGGLGYGNVAAWVEGLFDHPNDVQFDDVCDVRRAHALAECDAVLLCTGDVADLKTLIERTRRRAPGAAIFSVSDRLSPRQRAMVLGWGAEDVLDTGMAPREGAARIRSVCRRMAMTKAAQRLH